ncbi:MAG: hypothetical protein KC441_03105 [Anaerolineales bacterium]|nr:hypothetical protein [Anaerolineales bacterium]
MKTRAIVLFLLALIVTACGGANAAHTPDDVISAFRAAGLEAENAQPLTRDDYGAAPYVGQGVRFLIPSLCADCGGRVFALDNQKDLESVKTYYDALGESNALFFSWTFAKDNILVQINGDLDETTARQYETALNGLD